MPSNTEMDFLAHYKRGDDLYNDIQNLEQFGELDKETGSFSFQYCDSCGGPQLGHITEKDECNIKPKMKKAKKECSKITLT